MMKGIATSLAAFLLAGSQVLAQAPHLYGWYNQGHEYYANVGMPVGGQVVGQILPGQHVYLNPVHQLGFWNDGAAPAGGLAVSLPEGECGVYEDLGDDLVDFTQSGGRLSFRRIDPMAPGGSGYFSDMGSRSTTQFTTSPLGLTRSWDTPRLTSDNAIGHLAVDLQVAAGALAGYNNLDINLFNPHDLGSGLSVSIVPGSVVLPPEFSWSGQEYVHLSGTGPGALNGTYHFECDLQVTRSGPYAQASFGDLIFVPSTEVSYANQQWLSTSGRSIAFPGTAVEASVHGPADTSWDVSLNHDQVRLGLGALIGGDAPAVVENINLLKFKNKGLDGNMLYQFSCELAGQNIAAATLLTPPGPNQTTYELQVDYDDDVAEAEMFINAASEAELVNRGFINGQYTLTIYDTNAVPTAIGLTLSGDYPSALPVLTVNSLADPDNATVAWQAAPPGTTGLHVSLQAGELSDHEQFLAPTDTAINFGPVPPVGHEAVVSFFNGFMGPNGGIDQIIGYVAQTTAILDVLSSGDFSLDGQVEQADLTALLSNWGNTAVSVDWTGDFDGLVDQNELTDLLANWGRGVIGGQPLAGSPVPEPAGLLVLLVGAGLAGRGPRRSMGR